MTTTYSSKSEEVSAPTLNVKRSYTRALKKQCKVELTFTVPERGINRHKADEITALIRNYEFTQQVLDTPYFSRLNTKHRALFDYDGMPVTVKCEDQFVDGARGRHGFMASVNTAYYEKMQPGSTYTFTFHNAGKLEIEVAKQLRGILKRM
ncbi:MAG: hypothetical protein QW165_01735 [Candidatus Woesearchaeota archaeon]